MKPTTITAGSVVLLATGAASFAETIDDQAAARIQALEARVMELEATDSDLWLTEARADEIRSLVTDVISDADLRSSMLSSNLTAGYDNGAVVGSSDGSYSIKANLILQQRFIWNNQDDSGTADDDRYGFENTRSKFVLTGNVVSKDWFYRVDVNVANGGGTRGGVGNAYVGHHFDDGVNSIIMGTFKTPLLREDMVETQHQLAVERSVLNYAFTGGYTDGIAWMHKQDTWRLWASFNDGANTGQTNFGVFDTDWSVTGRAEFLLGGNWDQFNDFTNGQGEPGGWMVGVAGHYQEGESGSAAASTDVSVLTADISWEGDGANVYAAVMYADVDTDGAPSVEPLGFLVQGGFYFAEDWEMFARYEYADWDTAAEDLGIFTIGVNKYFAGHNVKWTTDVGFGTDEVMGGAITGAPASITGYRSDAAGQDGQLVIRTQWQMVF
ncbi:MAG: hypothetical protein AAF432_15815 [Planctomycetota bacterium]